MRRLLSILVIAIVSCSCARAALPYLDISSDVQKPDDEFNIKRVYSGNTPLIRWTAYDSSVTNKVADLTGWTFALWYAADRSATSGWYVSQASITNNSVIFSSITNFFAIPNDNYYATIYGTHQSGYIKTWGVGRMNQKWDFVSGASPYTNTTGILNTTQLNWSVFSSYVGAWPFFAGPNVTLTTASTGMTITANIPDVFTGNVRAASSAGLAMLNSGGSTTALFGVGGGLSAMFMDGASFAGQISGNAAGLTNVLDITNRVLASTGVSVTNANGKVYIGVTTTASNGVNNAITASGPTGAVSLVTNTLTVAFPTNVTAGAYSTSALLTLAVSGTNVVGGLSSAVATGNQWNATLTGYVQRVGDTMSGSLTTPGIVVGGGTLANGGLLAVGSLPIADGNSSIAFGNTVQASGFEAIAMGDGSFATQDNTFVWSDGTFVGSTSTKQFTVYAEKGIRLLGGPIAGDGSGLTNLNASSLSAGTVPLARLSGITSNQIDAATDAAYRSGGAASLSPWTNTVNAAGNSLTNLNFVQWSAPTNYQWIRWVGTNPVEAILVNASGGITGRVMRYSGADYIIAP